MTQPVAQPTTPPATTPPADPMTSPAGDPPKDDNKPLGPGGEKALQAERDARKELERQLAALAPLQKLATALGGGDPSKGKSEIEQLAERLGAQEKTLAEERAARWRAEVAHEKGLTPAQASRLVGNTREELGGDADALLTLFPATPAATQTSGTPAPDPSQGARGGQVPDLAAQIAEAEAKGDHRAAIMLKARQLINKK